MALRLRPTAFGLLPQGRTFQLNAASIRCDSKRLKRGDFSDESYFMDRIRANFVLRIPAFAGMTIGEMQAMNWISPTEAGSSQWKQPFPLFKYVRN